jgi:hypothetical protein
LWKGDAARDVGTEEGMLEFGDVRGIVENGLIFSPIFGIEQVKQKVEIVWEQVRLYIIRLRVGIVPVVCPESGQDAFC